MEQGFSVPVHLRDLEVESAGYTVDRSVVESGLASGGKAQLQALGELEARLEDDGVLAVFDELYLFVREAEALEDAVRSKLVGVLCRATAVAKEDPALRGGAVADPRELRRARDAYLMACYLAQAAIVAAETEARKAKGAAAATKTKKKSSSAETWVQQRPEALVAFAGALEGVDIKWLYSLGVADEPFLLLWIRVASTVLNESSALPKTAKDAAFALIAAPYKAGPIEFAASAAAAVVEELVLASESGATCAAEACAFLAQGPNRDSRFAGDILRELTRVAAGEAGAESSKSAKCVACFIDRLGDKAPSLALAHVSTLKEYLDSPAYALRSAVVATLARALASEAESKEPQEMSEEDEENNCSGKMSQQTRDGLWDLLTQRVRDISHLTRAATLKALTSLVEKQIVPLDRFVEVSLVARERLRDKNVAVRRWAMALLTKCVEHNPYGPNLAPGPFETELRNCEAVLLALDEEAVTSEVAVKPEEEEEEEEEAVNAALEKKRDEATRKFKYNRNATFLIEQVEGGSRDALRLLRSGSASDAVESAKFFGVASAFNLPCGVEGLRSVLPLACSKLEAVRAEAARVVGAALRVGDKTARPDVPARHLCDLLRTCGLTELGCLQEIAASAEQPGSGLPRLASPKMVRALWDLATNAEAARVPAIMGLSLAASAVGGAAIDAAALTEVVAQNLSDADFFECELGAAVADLLKSAAETTMARNGSTTFPAATKETCLLVLGKLRAGLAMASLKPAAWYTCADATLVATFILDSKPEEAAAELIASLAKRAKIDDPSVPTEAVEAAKLFHVVGHLAIQLLASTEELGVALKKAKNTASMARPASSKEAGNEEEEEVDDDELDKELGAGIEQSDADHDMRIQSIVENDILAKNEVLGKYGSLVAKVVSEALPRGRSGQTAAGLRVPAELQRSAVLCLAKLACVSRRFCDEHLALLVTTLAKAQDAPSRMNVAVAVGDLAARQPNSVEPWTEYIYAALRDENRSVRSTVLTTLAHLALNDMIKAKGGGMAEVALRIVDDDALICRRACSFFDELANKATATHSPIYNVLPDVISRLSKLRRTMVSVVEEQEESTPTKEEAAPKEEEEVVEELGVPESKEGDEDAPKEEEGDEELGVPESKEEEDDKKRESAVSASSTSSTRRRSKMELSAKDFQTIMGFLLKFVDKEKHLEAIAEKLCQRINGTRADDDALLKKRSSEDGEEEEDIPVDGQAEARRDFAFCLSKLKLTEKVVRKLHELTPMYKDALVDEEVYALFASVAAKAGKLANKPTDGFEELLADWSNKLQCLHDGMALEELEGAGPEVEGTPKQKPPPSARKKRPTAKKAAAKKKKDNDSDDDDDDDDGPTKRPPPSSSRAKRPTRAKKSVVEDDEDDDDDDDENAPPTVNRATPRHPRRARA